MTNKLVPAIPMDATKDLKSVFEQSLAIMCEEKLTSSNQEKVSARKSKLRRAVPLHIDAADLQKRALDNAARALATLWNVSKPGRPKSPVMLPHRQTT